MGTRTRIKHAVGALTLLVSLTGLAACGQEEPPAAPPAPLRILLVNDDGWNAPGIVSVREALRRAGHRVIEIAPAADRGDTGTAASMTAPLQVRRPTADRDLYTVSGTASDATLIGVQSIMGDAWPDLVISGVNSQRSVGLDAMRSGTVGAAMTAAALGFPAVAVSTETADPRRARPTEFARSADFTVRLVEVLQRTKPSDGPLMPKRTVLNVNYPQGPEPARSVSIAPTADASAVSLYYRIGRTPETYIPTPTVAPAPGGENDASALSSGHAVLTDLSADPDRAAPPQRLAARLQPLLKP